jgi:hypothetical protein
MVNKLREASASLFLLLAVALAISGCSGSSSRMVAASEPPAVATPSADKAGVVFMRPYSLGSGVQSTLFDITDDSSTFIGIVSAKKKIAYQAPPGVRRFMVVGETAKFLEVDVAAGRTYFVSVEPHMGVWKARFSMDLVSRDSPSFASDYSSCTWVENTPESSKWAGENAASINEKKAASLPEWLKSRGKTLQ